MSFGGRVRAFLLDLYLQVNLFLRHTDRLFTIYKDKALLFLTGSLERDIKYIS